VLIPWVKFGPSFGNLLGESLGTYLNRRINWGNSKIG